MSPRLCFQLLLVSHDLKIANISLCRMASTEFQTLYTERRLATDGPPPLLYCECTKETQEMYELSHMTGIVAIVKPKCMVTMEVAPIYKKVGLVLWCILLNSSNNELAPAMAMSGMLNHFPTLDTWQDVPDFAIKCALSLLPSYSKVRTFPGPICV